MGGKREIAQHDPGEQLSQYGGLTDSLGDLATDLGGDHDDHQSEQDRRDRAGVRAV